MNRFLLFLICTCFAYNIFAQEVNEDAELTEPFMGESVAPQEKYEFQIVNNSIFQKSPGLYVINNSIEIEYGITDRFTAEIGYIPLIFEKYPDRSGKYSSGNIEIGGNYSFMNIFNSLHLSIGFEFEIPVSAQQSDLIENESEFVPYFIVAHDFTWFNQIQIYAGFYPSVFGDEKEIALRSGAIIPFKNFHNTFELSYLNFEGENITYLAPGIAFPFENGFELGLSTPIGISELANPYEVIFRLFYEF